MDNSKFTEELITLIAKYQEDPDSEDIFVDFAGSQEDIIIDFISKVIGSPEATPANKAQWVDELLIDLNKVEEAECNGEKGSCGKCLTFSNKYSILEVQPESNEYITIENIKDNYDSWRVLPDEALVYCVNGTIMLLGKDEDGTEHSKMLNGSDESDYVYLDKGDMIMPINLATGDAVSTLCITSETNLSKCGSVPLQKGELSKLLSKYIKDLEF